VLAAKGGTLPAKPLESNHLSHLFSSWNNRKGSESKILAANHSTVPISWRQSGSFWPGRIMRRVRITRRVTALAALTLICAVASTGACGGGRPPRVSHGACNECNVLLITIDTLRSDRVGAFGGSADLTPTLDRFAAEGLRFTRAYSSAPLTLPSHASILTGVSPPGHGIRTNGLFRLGTTLPTLATIFKAAGYRTGAFAGAFVLDARFGLNRGFDVYDDRYGEKHAGSDTDDAERRAEDVIKPATEWINLQSAINQQSAISNLQSQDFLSSCIALWTSCFASSSCSSTSPMSSLGWPGKRSLRQ